MGCGRSADFACSDIRTKLPKHVLDEIMSAHFSPVDQNPASSFFLQATTSYCPRRGKYPKRERVIMHRQRLIFGIFLFVLPIEAQSNRALPPNRSEDAGNLLPPHDYSSLLAQHQGTSPAAGRAMYRWSVAAVLRKASRMQPVVGGLRFRMVVL